MPIINRTRHFQGHAHSNGIPVKTEGAFPRLVTKTRITERLFSFCFLNRWYFRNEQRAAIFMQTLRIACSESRL